jgi:hypothetical protein
MIIRVAREPDGPRAGGRDVGRQDKNEYDHNGGSHSSNHAPPPARKERRIVLRLGRSRRRKIGEAIEGTEGSFTTEISEQAEQHIFYGI